MRIALPVMLALLCLARAAAPPSDFTVRAPADQSVFRLSEARGRFVVLHFLLKTECPFCLRHTREYARRAAELPGVQQVFLKPDSADDIRSWTRSVNPESGVPPTIYQDPGAALAEAFGIPGGYEFHGEKMHFPALILLDPEGREIFRHVGKDNSDRYEFNTLAGRIREARAKHQTPPIP